MATSISSEALKIYRRTKRQKKLQGICSFDRSAIIIIRNYKTFLIYIIYLDKKIFSMSFMHDRQTDGQSKLYTLPNNFPCISSMTFPLLALRTDCKTDKVNNRVVQLLINLTCHRIYKIFRVINSCMFKSISLKVRYLIVCPKIVQGIYTKKYAIE